MTAVAPVLNIENVGGMAPQGQDVNFDPRAHGTVFDHVPAWAYKAAAAGAGLLLVGLSAGCEYKRDAQGHCAEENTYRQKQCLAQDAHDKPQQHLSPLGLALDDQILTDNPTWTTYTYNGRDWSIWKDGADYNSLLGEVQQTALNPGEKATKRDEAAVACTMARVILTTRDNALPVTPVALDFPSQFVTLIRAGAITPSQLLQDGLNKFREAANRGDDVNSDDFGKAAGFCSVLGAWVLVGEPYKVDTGTVVMKACGPACIDNRLFPVPAGVREAAAKK